MKFLCIACDEAMALKETQGPEEGSMSVVFGCPSCGRDIAMLTNPMETQMVRSLGVAIGGRQAAPEPMETLRGSLAHSHHPAEPKRTGAGCPFTGIVEEATERQQSVIVWTAGAEERINRIPSFARTMARKGVEQFAQERGLSEINEDVMNDARGQYGL